MSSKSSTTSHEGFLGKSLLFGAVILPLLAGALFKVPRIALDNFTDAVFYLSYARQFGELVLRYGFPYYATRFGGILPDALSGQLFGDIIGIWILRYALSSAVSLSLFLCFRKRYGAIAGLVASILWSFNPAALRLLCTTYVDSTAVPFLILGCVIFATAGGNLFLCALAGVLLALASSAHLYAAFALILLVPWMMGTCWERRAVLVRSIIWTSAGFLGAFLLGCLWYWAVWGMPALFSPTMEVMHDLGAGQTSLWKKTLSVALHETPAWFAPLSLLPALLLASLRGSSLVRGAAISLLASTGFFWGGDLFGNAYVLSMPFYYSFLIPVMTLASATLCGELISSKEKRKGLILLSVIGISLSLFLVASTGMFAQMLGRYPYKDLPVLELALELRKALPKASVDGSVMRFWYDDDLARHGGGDRRMIGAFWLHTFGKLTGRDGSFVIFPKISDSDATAIAFSGPDRLVIFDQNPDQVSEGIDEIRSRKLPYRLAREFILHAPSDGSRTLNVAILDRDVHQNADVGLVTYDLMDIHVIHHGQFDKREEGVNLTSGFNKWWDFAKLPLGSLKKGENIHVRFQVESGNIRFALNVMESQLFEHIEKWPTSGEQELVLTAPQDLKDAWLSLHSMYPNGSRSGLLIKKIWRD